MDAVNKVGGMRTFYTIWIGQLVSTFGSGLTAFALAVWLFQQTGTVTPLAFLLLFKTLPVVILAPFAGALVDRFDRRVTMIAADSVAALSTITLAILFLYRGVELWQLYLLVALASAAEAFQVPAFLASLTLLVPAEQYGQANGLTQVSRGVAEILAPLLAGLLLVVLELPGVLLIDVVTFVIAVLTLLLVRIPMPARAEAEPVRQRLNRQELFSGFGYIAARPGLAWLLGFFVIVFFLSGFISALIEPLILSFTTPQVLGIILTIAGTGLLSGSLLLSAWGGPQRRITGVLGFAVSFGLCLVLIGLRPLPWLIALAAFGAHFSIPFVNGLNQAIWQSIVEEAIQGRVFAVRLMLGRSAQALAFILAGPLADRVAEPLLTGTSAIQVTFRLILGSGTGRGAGLIFVISGALTALIALLAFLNPQLRGVEGERLTNHRPAHGHVR